MIKTALLLLLCQGFLGALDTVWYHEWKQRLPASPIARRELRLHASRDFVYTLLFGSLAWLRWEGLYTWLLGVALLVEIAITLFDFVEEDRTRQLPAGERVMHTIMAILYGAMLANLIPQIIAWSARPTCFHGVDYGMMSWMMTALAAGALVSGIRDLLAATGYVGIPRNAKCEMISAK
jgi:hypothetical protein